jgi:hypothetical protein
MKPALLALSLLLTSATALADDHPIKSVECHMDDGRFVASLAKGENGIFRAKITRYLNGRASVRFEGPVNFAIGDTADGSTVLMFGSTEVTDPSSERVPEFDLTVTDGTAGELYSSHFRFPKQSVKGPCTIN